MNKRSGVTLLELLIVLAVIAILIGLLVPAVVYVRNLAARSESSNNLRQIGLALHSFAGDNGGRLPTLDYQPHIKPIPKEQYPWGSVLLPYIEQPAFLAFKAAVKFHPVMQYLSPADPTLAAGFAAEAHVSSYAANARAFRNNPRLPQSFLDGTSNTIAFAEHYSYGCSGTGFYPFTFGGAVSENEHRATFADVLDVVPITKGNPPISFASYTKLTFQAAPPIAKCNPSVPQTPHSSGMLTAMADASVRVISPSVSETAFWSAVTPAGREPIGTDW